MEEKSFEEQFSKTELAMFIAEHVMGWMPNKEVSPGFFWSAQDKKARVVLNSPFYNMSKFAYKSETLFAPFERMEDALEIVHIVRGYNIGVILKWAYHAEVDVFAINGPPFGVTMTQDYSDFNGNEMRTMAMAICLMAKELYNMSFFKVF